MIRLFFILSLTLTWSTIWAQQEHSSLGVDGIGLKAGWTQAFIADQHSSPLLYQVNTMNFGALYQQQSNHLFEIGLLLNIGTSQAQNIGKRVGTLADAPDIYGESESYEVEANPFLSFLGGDLSIKMLWPLNDRHHLGLSTNLRYMKSGIGLDDWHYTQLDLSPEYAFAIPLFAGQLTASFSLPVLAGIVRPNYSLDPSLPNLTNYYRGYLRTGSSITSLHQLINPRLGVGYTWSFNNNRDIGIQYSAKWISYPDPRPVRIFEQGVDLVYFF